MPKIRVLIVDDSVVIRRMISDALANDPAFEVVGVAPHGGIALQKIPQVNPDIITLDVEMPEMDGITTLRAIRKIYPKLPVIMFSTLTGKGAAVTVEALAAGASDYVAKPANVGSVTEGMQRLGDDLIPKIKALCRAVPPFILPLGLAKSTTSALRIPAKPAGPIEIICLGTSTGGPNALPKCSNIFPAIVPSSSSSCSTYRHSSPAFWPNA